VKLGQIELACALHARALDAAASPRALVDFRNSGRRTPEPPMTRAVQAQIDSTMTWEYSGAKPCWCSRDSS
jgi:hypothetical protein